MLVEEGDEVVKEDTHMCLSVPVGDDDSQSPSRDALPGLVAAPWGGGRVLCLYLLQCYVGQVDMNWKLYKDV